MMLIPSEIGQDPTTYQLDGRDNLRVKYDEDMLSGVIEQQVDGAWESTGQLVTPEYKNDDFFGGIVGFTIADDIPNASTSFPISTPPDASSTFPALSDRERQLADPSGGFQVHEGGGIGTLVTPYPTDPSLSAPMPGFPADSGVKPVQVMMNESSENIPNNSKVLNSNFDEFGNLTPEAQELYQRPSGYRKGVREQVWENAKAPDGNVYDPVSNDIIDPELPWDMGHKPGFEFRKHQQSAAERNITRQQFLDEHNIPEHFRPELPSSNRSHRGEDLTDDYFGF
jgi:hypothetical protein